MHPDFYQLAELAVGLLALYGLGLGFKTLIWDRGPWHRLRDHQEHRIEELEKQCEMLLELNEQQARQLREQAEQLDFDRRVLARDWQAHRD